MSEKSSNFAPVKITESYKDMTEQEFIDAINRSMQESAAHLRAMGREPYTITREEAEKQVAMLLKAKEEFFAKNTK